jgi:hypothetical protein
MFGPSGVSHYFFWYIVPASGDIEGDCGEVFSEVIMSEKYSISTIRVLFSFEPMEIRIVYSLGGSFH